MGRMGQSYSIGTVLGIPVRAHATLLLMLPVFAASFAPTWGLQGWIWGGLGAAGLFGSVALHEIGHSVVARSKGARIVEILLLPIGGMARLERMPSRPGDEIQTALAGPATSLGLGLLGTILAGPAGAANGYLGLLLGELGRINFVLAAFNMIPSFPMDGGRVLRAALVPRLGRLRATRLAAGVGRVLAWIFGIWAIWPAINGGRPNLMLLLIAFFVYQSAGEEARQAEAEAAWARGNGVWREWRGGGR